MSRINGKVPNVCPKGGGLHTFEATGRSAWISVPITLDEGGPMEARLELEVRCARCGLFDYELMPRGSEGEMEAVQ